MILWDVRPLPEAGCPTRPISVVLSLLSDAILGRLLQRLGLLNPLKLVHGLFLADLGGLHQVVVEVTLAQDEIDLAVSL